MNRLGALLFAAVAGHAAPLYAGDASIAAPNRNAAIDAAAAPGAADNDVTGAIDRGPRSGAPAVDSAGAAPASLQGRAPTCYEEAFRNWRICAIAHQGVGNPAPQCEPLRAACAGRSVCDRAAEGRVKSPCRSGRTLSRDRLCSFPKVISQRKGGRGGSGKSASTAIAALAVRLKPVTDRAEGSFDSAAAPAPAP